ncbi:RNA helicase aquarius-like isoform 1-T2 [Trichechus inunguis]
MSRARLGLYVFARVSLFQNCFELTPAFSQLTARPLHLHIIPTEPFPATRKNGERPSHEVQIIKNMPQMANFVYNMYMHLIQTTHHYHQTFLQLPPAMVEEGEGVQSQETELETEEETTPVHGDVLPGSADASSSQERSASETETTPDLAETIPGPAEATSNQTASSDPEATHPQAETTAAVAASVTAPTKAHAPQEATPTPAETSAAVAASVTAPTKAHAPQDATPAPAETTAAVAASVTAPTKADAPQDAMPAPAETKEPNSNPS